MGVFWCVPGSLIKGFTTVDPTLCRYLSNDISEVDVILSTVIHPTLNPTRFCPRDLYYYALPFSDCEGQSYTIPSPRVSHPGPDRRSHGGSLNNRYI